MPERGRVNEKHDRIPDPSLSSPNHRIEFLSPYFPFGSIITTFIISIHLCPQLPITSCINSLLTFLFLAQTFDLSDLSTFLKNRWNRLIDENLGLHFALSLTSYWYPFWLFSSQKFPLLNIFLDIFSFQIFPLLNIFPEIFSFQIFCARRSQEWVYRGDKRENNSLHPWKTPSKDSSLVISLIKLNALHPWQTPY